MVDILTPVGSESKKVTETAATDLEIERRCFQIPRTCMFLALIYIPREVAYKQLSSPIIKIGLLTQSSDSCYLIGS